MPNFHRKPRRVSPATVTPIIVMGKTPDGTVAASAVVYSQAKAAAAAKVMRQCRLRVEVIDAKSCAKPNMETTETLFTGANESTLVDAM